MPQRRMAWLDALRAVAALLVVYAHLSHYLLRGARNVSAEWLHAGPAGVMLFFLVSGYIIPASLERHGDLRRFWLGRLARLYPLYLVVCVLVALTVPLTVSGAVAHLTMLPQLLGAPLLTPVVWTLSFEMAFYLIVAALFALRLHRASAWAAIAFAVTGVATAPLSPSRLAGPALPFLVAAVLVLGLAALTARRRAALTARRRAALTARRRAALTAGRRRAVPAAGAVLLLALAITLLLADQDVSHVWDGLLIPAVMFTGTTIYRAQQGQIPRRHAVATMAVVAAALLTNWFAELASLHALTPRYAARSVITLAVIGGAFAIGLACRNRRVPSFLAWLGVVSYSIYLIHVPLISLLAPLLSSLGERLHGPIELLAVAGFLAVLFGLSWFAHRFVELPGQRLGRLLTDRFAAPPGQRLGRLLTDRFAAPPGQRLRRLMAEQRGEGRDGAEEQAVGPAVGIADEAEDGVRDEGAAAQGHEVARGQLPAAQ
ncbi:acyltransferase [Actinoplanes sp. KI2]|uniref:acyltransferase family protein n=1 Tax=Actinoplanes sp. KI2 TaxID=2983315 RepID=UPI0021D58755|nr:acyltransferase [Actinoplanes sp. KI2]MCU7728583.1 acyltransferase [Actinoplanes sp. KI2]